MLKLGERVYSWDDIKESIETYTVFEGSRPNAREYQYIVIGTVVDVRDRFVEIQLVSNRDVFVTCDKDFVFPVGTGPIMRQPEEKTASLDK